MEKETTVNDLLIFLEKNMVTKEEFNNEIGKLREEMQGGFARVDKELAEIKAELKKLDERTFQDTSVASAEIVKLERRVNELEKQVQQLRLQAA